MGVFKIRCWSGLGFDDSIIGGVAFFPPMSLLRRYLAWLDVACLMGYQK